MRQLIVIVLGLLMIALIACAIIATRSKRPIAKDVCRLLIALIPPMLGNLIIIASPNWGLARLGCYTYYIGLDITVFVLLQFTYNYCAIAKARRAGIRIAAVLVALDIAQLLLNPVFGHAFTTSMIMVEGMPYHMLVPLLGQRIHRLVAYGILFVSMGIFAYRTFTVPRIYVERYAVILVCMVVTTLWETFYIFSGTPIDRSMLGFGFFGLLVNYFALYYRPYRLRDRMLARVVSDMGEAVLFFDLNNTCIYANSVAFSLFDLEDNDDLDCAPMLVEAAINRKISFDSDWSQHCSIRQNGEQRYWNVSFHQLFDERGFKSGSFLTIYDRTEDEQRLQKEVYLASHDRLTGLYNRDCLYDRARTLIDENPDTFFLVIALDIKEFKLVNDIFSKESGDKVLVKIADILRELATPHEVYGRISGDRFGFVLPADEFNPVPIEFRLSNLQVDEGVNYPISPHLGIYEVTNRQLSVSVMFDRAFMAIASIKNDYHNHFATYDDSMRENVVWSQKISSQLDQAIAEGQIQPYLQPLVSSTGEVEGAEVLVRWMHPEEGFLSPARFVPVFEENGCIARMDMYMWECACRILRKWQDEGITQFLSVNISPKDFYFIDVESTITSLVERYGIDPKSLRLEITETVMMSDIEKRLSIIDHLRSHGFIIEMDDFGSGYSSLNMLKDLPVDVLKIDMMFLYKTKDYHRAQTILQTIIDLSMQLGISSITEGVETAEQRDMLVNMGCRLFQGYYFARPMPEDDFEAFYQQPKQPHPAT